METLWVWHIVVCAAMFKHAHMKEYIILKFHSKNKRKLHLINRDIHVCNICHQYINSDITLGVRG